MACLKHGWTCRSFFAGRTCPREPHTILDALLSDLLKEKKEGNELFGGQLTLFNSRTKIDTAGDQDGGNVTDQFVVRIISIGSVPFTLLFFPLFSLGQRNMKSP